MNDIEKVRYLIGTTQHMVVASADSSGKPWISPVFFAPDEQNSLYWVSSKTALHSENIRGRPAVAIAIFGPMPDGDTDGVYIDAMAHELGPGVQLEKAITSLRQRPQPPKFTINNEGDVLGSACWRVYVATPLSIAKRVDAVDAQSGQAITVRKLVKLQ